MALNVESRPHSQNCRINVFFNLSDSCFTFKVQPSTPLKYSAGLIKPFHSRDQRLCKFIGTKRKFLHKERFNIQKIQRIGLGYQHGRHGRCFVLGH